MLAEAFAFLGFFAAEPAPRCEAPSASLVVSPVFNGHRVEHGRSRASLALSFGRPTLPGHEVHGLTEVGFSTNSKVSVAVAKMPDGTWCATAKDVHVSFGLEAPVDVLIASELAEGSCEWRAVLDHEMEHVKVAEDAVHSGTEALRLSLAGILEPGLTGLGRTQAEADASVRKAVASVIERAVSSATASAERRNAELDSPESYGRLARACR